MKCPTCPETDPNKFGKSRTKCNSCLAKANRFNPKSTRDTEWFGGVPGNLFPHGLDGVARREIEIG